MSSATGIQQQQGNGIAAPQGADGLAALLAGLGFPQFQQARELQRLQQGQQRAQPQADRMLPNQQGGLRVEIGFGAGGIPQHGQNIQTIPLFGVGNNVSSFLPKLTLNLSLSHFPHLILFRSRQLMPVLVILNWLQWKDENGPLAKLV